MRIVHTLDHCFPGGHRGGISSSVYNLARAQAASGANVLILTVVGSEIRESFPNGGLFNVCTISGIRRGSSWRRQLVQTLWSRRDSIDILHSHCTFTAVDRLTYTFSLDTGIPLALHRHGSLDPVLLNEPTVKALKKRVYINAIEKRILEHARVVFALTPYERYWIDKCNESARLAMLPNCIPANKFSLGSQSSRFREVQNNQVRILSVGRIVPKKRIELILATGAELQERSIDVEIRIGGNPNQDARYVSYLKRESAALGLMRSVKWLGHLNDSEKEREFATADVFMLLSRSEGFPMAVLEAMSYGLPCVISPETHMEVAVSRGAAIEAGNSREASTALMQLLSRPSGLAVISTAAQQFVQQEHNCKKLAELSFQCYATAL